MKRKRWILWVFSYKLEYAPIDDSDVEVEKVKDNEKLAENLSNLLGKNVKNYIKENKFEKCIWGTFSKVKFLRGRLE